MKAVSAVHMAWFVAVFAAVQLGACPHGAGRAEADDCITGAWTQIGEDIFQRTGCVAMDRAELKFHSVAFNLSKYKMSLSGSGEGGAVPHRTDVPTELTRALSAPYSLNRFVDDSGQPKVAAPVGYPISPKLFAPEGLVRIAGRDVSERDTSSTFKSAMVCLNEVKRNPGKGSRVVVFNAFENESPVELNPRVQDAENCRDVFQAGPRIVEYIAKRGIRSNERDRAPQKYLVFSQGDGPVNYYGYLTIFLEPANLYLIQELLLANGALSQFDTRMRVAVALTTDAYSAMMVRDQDGRYRVFGDVTKPNPVYLSVDLDP